MGQRNRFVPIHLGEGFLPLAQKTAQHCVDEASGPRLARTAGERNRLRHGRVVRGTQIDELIESEQQDDTDVTVPGLERPPEMTRGTGLQPRQKAQHTKAQLLGERPVRRLRDLLLKFREQRGERTALTQDLGQYPDGRGPWLHDPRRVPG